MEFAEIESAPSHFVKPPRVAASPCALECKLLQIVQLFDLDGSPVERFMILGRVVGVYINDTYIHDGILDTAGMQPLSRCGYMDYAVTDRTFPLRRTSGVPMKGPRISLGGKAAR